MLFQNCKFSSPGESPATAESRSMRRLLKAFFLVFGLLSLALVGLFALSLKQYYKRELVPWLEPEQSLWSWRWQGIKNAPLAFYDQWALGEPDHRRKKRIALTFDDGPYPLYTPLLVDILNRYQVKATFFVVGIHVREYPSLARQIVRDGHEIANHTHTHRRQRDISLEDFREDVLACEFAIEDLTGHRPRLFRPAGGFVNDEGLQVVRDLGYTVCNATINPGDWWQRDPDLLIRFSYRGRSREGVTLMHTGALGIVKAMPGYINALKAKGFEFVTVSELAELKGSPLPELPRRRERPESSGPAHRLELGNPLPESGDEYSQ